jgi:hypothetical protein
VAYAGGLYAATYAVKTNGEIEMIEDLPIAALDGLDVPACPALVAEPVDPKLTGAERLGSCTSCSKRRRSPRLRGRGNGPGRSARDGPSFP